MKRTDDVGDRLLLGSSLSLLRSSTEDAKEEGEGGLVLDVVVREGMIILEVLVVEDQALLVLRDALLVLDDALEGVDRVRSLDA